MIKSVILSLIVISIVSCVLVKTQNKYIAKVYSVSDLNKDDD